MATLKIVLRKLKNKDQTSPLIIRITQNRKSSIFHLGLHVHEKDWDAKAEKVKKSHPNSVRLNNLLLKKKAEANDKLLELAAKNEDTSSRTIKNKIHANQESSFFAQAKIFTDNLKSNGKYNRHTTDIGRIERFKEFLNGHDITFPEITVNLLNQFRGWLKSTRKIAERTIVNYLLLIRTIYNQAANNNLTDCYDIAKCFC